MRFGENGLFGQYLVNRLLYAAGACFRFLLLRNVLAELRSQWSPRAQDCTAWFVTLMFAIHPVQVESVAWISSRKYGLLSCFGFAALWALFMALREPKKQRRWLIIHGVTIALAMLSSPFAIVLPALALVIHWACGIRNRQAPKLHGIGWGLAVLIGPVLWWVLVAGAGGQIERATATDGRGLGTTLFTMLRVLADYLGMLTLPLWLNNRYPDNLQHAIDARVALGALLALGGVALAWWRWQKGDRAAALCVAWFVIALAPVSNLIPISTVKADRYLYLACVGPLLGLALTWPLLGRRVVWGGAALLLAGATLSVARNRVWRDSEALWTASLAAAPENGLAHNNLGRALADEDQLSQAIEHLKKAVELEPADSGFRNNLAVTLMRAVRFDEAVPILEGLLADDPGSEQVSNAQRAITTLTEAGQHHLALQLWTTLNATVPNEMTVQLLLGNTALRTAAYEQTIAAYRAVLSQAPNNLDARHNLIAALGVTGQKELALGECRVLVTAGTARPEVYYNMGRLLLEMGRRQEAIEALQTALSRGYAPASQLLQKAQSAK